MKELLARSIPEGYGNRMITGDLVDTGDLVLLVMPQDIQAPKGETDITTGANFKRTIGQKMSGNECDNRSVSVSLGKSRSTSEINHYRLAGIFLCI